MFSGRTNKSTLLRLLTIIVTSVFLLQSAVAGINSASHSDNQFGVVCANPQPSSGDVGNPTSPTSPAVPVGHHGFCCVLHTVAAYFPPNLSYAYLIRLQFADDRFPLWTSEGVPSSLLEPSKAPQSPRAPPHQV